MKFDFTYFLLRVLRYYYYCTFPGFSRTQLKNQNMWWTAGFCENQK
jgi:hypothetical protein